MKTCDRKQIYVEVYMQISVSGGSPEPKQTVYEISVRIYIVDVNVFVRSQG